MTNYRFMGRRKTLWFFISGVLFAVGIIALVVWKLPLGIDFKGGAESSVTLDRQISVGDIRAKVAGYTGGSGATVLETGERQYLLRFAPISNEQHQDILKRLQEDFGLAKETAYQLVGPTISRDLTKKAAEAVGIASLLIVLYLAYSFREVRDPVSSWRFGLTAVAALLHDLIISAGIFTMLAHWLGWEVDVSVVTALLTIMGFSVHDTIVVFDRVRENLIHHKELARVDFEKIVDFSLTQTLNRSLATSLTVILTLAALVVLGGSTIRGFVSLLLIGITIGTYSSIFTASPLLVVWQNRTNRSKS